MKPLVLEPRSFIIGLAVALIASWILQGREPVAAQALHRPWTSPGPDPRRILTIREGEVFVVPAGKRFVSTGLGSTNPTVASVLLLADGIPELTTHTETPTTIRETPSWFSVPAGKSISVQGGDPAGDDARAFGYLIEE